MAVIDQPFYTILRSDRLLQPSTLPTGGRSFEYGADVPSYTLTVESLTTDWQLSCMRPNSRTCGLPGCSSCPCFSLL